MIELTGEEKQRLWEALAVAKAYYEVRGPKEKERAVLWLLGLVSLAGRVTVEVKNSGLAWKSLCEILDLVAEREKVEKVEKEEKEKEEKEAEKKKKKEITGGDDTAVRTAGRTARAGRPWGRKEK